jgi:hypothetical protein
MSNFTPGKSDWTTRDYIVLAIFCGIGLLLLAALLQPA